MILKLGLYDIQFNGQGWECIKRYFDNLGFGNKSRTLRKTMVFILN